MPFSFPFFRSQSNLLGNKKDNIQRAAAEDSKMRFDYEKGRQRIKEEKIKNTELELYEKKMDFNVREIERQRDELNRLDFEEKAYQQKIDTLIKTMSNNPKAIDKDVSLSEELSKKIQKIQEQRRHYNAEITRLEDQNASVVKKIH